MGERKPIIKIQIEESEDTESISDSSEQTQFLDKERERRKTVNSPAKQLLQSIIQESGKAAKIKRLVTLQKFVKTNHFKDKAKNKEFIDKIKNKIKDTKDESKKLWKQYDNISQKANSSPHGKRLLQFNVGKGLYDGFLRRSPSNF
jgi:hypothetical protein